MKKFSDEELLDELRQRLIQTKKSLIETERLMKRLEEVNKKLEESEKLKSNFLSNIKNEINNPLSSIMGLAQAIISIGKSDPDKAAAFASTISYESFNLDFQLKNIFISAELEGGECFVSSTSVDVIHILSGILESFKHLTDEKNISISYKTNPDSKKIIFKTDAEKLHLIFSNLIDNAIEYSVPGNKVNIVVNVEQEHLNLSVQNFGELINIPNKNSVFDRFTQLETGTKKRHKGHGLGLSVCRDLIEMMGGSIELSSGKKNGTVFSVTLPECQQDDFEGGFAEDGNEVLFTDGEKF